MAENGEHDTEEDYSFQDDGEGNEQLESFVAETEGDDSVQDQDNIEPERRVERTVSTASDGVDDPELEAIKVRVREMEEEAEKLKEMQTEVEKQMNLSSSSIGSPPGFPTMEEKVDADAKSIYVGNVDYGATAQELEAHFHGCGSINRVTILCDKFSGHPKGFAYIEFADRDSVQTATALDESLFRGRQIKVCPKRTNRPGVSSTDRAPRGRSRRPRTSYYYGYTPRSRGRYRGRRASWYSPY